MIVDTAVLFKSIFLTNLDPSSLIKPNTGYAALHSLDPGGLFNPVGQTTHEPPDEYFPLGHAWHAPPVNNVPGMHSHALVPVAEDIPAGQGIIDVVFGQRKNMGQAP